MKIYRINQRNLIWYDIQELKEIDYPCRVLIIAQVYSNIVY